MNNNRTQVQYTGRLITGLVVICGCGPTASGLSRGLVHTTDSLIKGRPR
jgi:hypothetical protein